VTAFKDLNTGAERGPSKSFAFMKLFDDVAIIGIDTTDPGFKTRGHVGKFQLNDIAHLVRAARDANCIPIVVGHHSPIYVHPSQTPWYYNIKARITGDDMNLTDGEDLVWTLKRAGCDLYLCGHWHRLPINEYYTAERGVRIWTQGRSGAMDQERAPFKYSYDLLSIRDGRVNRQTKGITC